MLIHKTAQSIDVKILNQLEPLRVLRRFQPRLFAPWKFRRDSQALERVTGEATCVASDADSTTGRGLIRCWGKLPRPDGVGARRDEDSGAQWQVSGAYAANLLHLSEQVPAKILILTDACAQNSAG